jgi:lipoyl(octanoyl) transferase
MGAHHLRVSRELLAGRGIDFVQTDRGGDITFHGPGQVVAYPIIRLADHRLSVGGYVRSLQQAVIGLLSELGVPARTDEAGIGVWADLPGESGTAKVCAVGVRVKRGVTLHGLALNVMTELSYFDLIVPCGLADRPVTSLHALLADRCPPIEVVRRRLGEKLAGSF